MSDEKRRFERADTQERAQEELNRQALVTLGKRLAEVEAKLGLMDRDVSELLKFVNNYATTIRGLQDLVEKLVDRELRKGSLL